MQLAAAPSGARGAAGGHAPTMRATTRGAAGAAANRCSAPWRVDLQASICSSVLGGGPRVQPAAKVALAPLTYSSTDRASTSQAGGGEPGRSHRRQGFDDGERRSDAEPASASLRVKLSGIDLTTAQPYIAQQTSMTVRSGRLGGEAEVNYSLPSRAECQSPPVQFCRRYLRRESAYRRRSPARRSGQLGAARCPGTEIPAEPDRLEIAEVRCASPIARDHRAGRDLERDQRA